MPVLPARGKTFEFTVPVVVVGAGAAGSTAALAARDGGAEVMLLERDHRPRGSTAMSQGNIAASGSKSQKRAGIDDSGEIFAADIMALTKGETDAHLARVFADASGPTIDWLTEKHQVPLEVDPDWGVALGHSRSRIHSVPSHTGTELITLLGNAVERAGIDLVTDAHVTDVYADESGAVRGVRFRRPDGSTEEVGCEALILGTCGFGANREMVAKFIPEMKDATYFGHEGNEGEGIEFGMGLGAATADMTAFQGLGALADPHRILIHYNIILRGGIIVNVKGERFTDESKDISGMGRKVSAQPEGLAWFIFDQRLMDLVSKYEETKEAVQMGAFRRAADLDELAALSKVPKAALEKTLAETQGLAGGTGKDRFGRDFTQHPALVGPPWWAVRVCGALFHTQGGLVIDENAQVCRPDKTKLPNLFAAGGTARGTSGPGDWGYIPAAGLFTAVTQGRLAGEAAARLVARKKRAAAE